LVHPDMLYRLFTSSLIVGLLSGFLACASALADNIRPACLEMEESDSGTIRVVWKVPRYQNIPDRFTPTFPQNCRDSSPRNRVVTRSAIIEMWNMAERNHRDVEHGVWRGRSGGCSNQHRRARADDDGCAGSGSVGGRIGASRGSATDAESDNHPRPCISA